MKKLSHAVDNEVFKNKKINTLNTRVINLDQKVDDGTNLIYINQCKRDIQFQRKKVEHVDKKLPVTSDYNCFEYKNQ